MNIVFQRLTRFFLIISFFLLVEKSTLKADSSPPIYLELNSPYFCTGLFNMFSMVLGLLHIYDQGELAGAKVDFKDQGLYYDAAYGPNWWQYYFEPIELGSAIGATYIVSTTDHHCHLSCQGEFNMTRERAGYLLQKYVQPKPHIQQKIKEFKQKYFGSAYVIGIHYRGTDKSSEAPRVPYEQVKEEVSRYLKKFKNRKVKIFVATDEQAFLDYMKREFINVVYLEDSIRSDTGFPVHLLFNQNYKKGEDAVLDCLLLSKCNMLIRTSSSLSLFSTYFNPNMRVVELNHRF